MSTLSVEVAVIGAGTAGLAAYRAAVAKGKRAVIIEGGPYGTTCARVGCMPSKLLIAAAEAAHAPVKWNEFGLRLDGNVVVDGPAVMSRVKRERDRFVGFVLEGVESIPAGDRIRGYARFVDDNTLVVDEDLQVANAKAIRITFERAVIATGSSPAIPSFLSATNRLGDRLIVNDDVFSWNDLPKSVAIFGPGVIGLEIGQALHRLGVDVLLFGRSGHVGPFSDPMVRAYALKQFSSELHLDAEAQVQSVTREGDEVEIAFRGRNGEIEIARVEYVIAATGRTPNVGNLGLEHTSIAVDASGIPLFDRTTMQCGASPFFIAGDANDELPLLHEAADEGKIAGDNAARWPNVESGMRRTPLAVVFTDPQLAVVGLRHAELEPASYVVGEVSFENQGRSRVMLRNRGMLHVYAEVATGLLLGAELIGPDAEHLAHLLAWAIQSGMTVGRALEMPFYHPVVEEGLRTALRDAQAKLAAAQLKRAA